MSKVKSDRTVQSPTRRQGTVLLELVVATFLVGSVTITLYLALIYGQLAPIKANHYARAGQLASQQIEILRSTAFANLTVPYNGPFIGGTDSIAELPSATANLVISYDDSPTNSIKKAVATVSWLDRGTTRNVSYSTFIVNNGLFQP